MKNVQKIFGIIAIVAIIGLLFTACISTNGGEIGSNVGEETSLAVSGETGPAINGISYKIGDIGPGGGIIFYINTNGFTVHGYGNPGDSGYFAAYTAHYLEVAPEDIGPPRTPRWCNCWPYCEIAEITISEESIGSWSSETPEQIAALTANVGHGRKNTSIIVAYHNRDNASNNAAIACYEYSNNGADDWFLPSIGELYWLNQNRRVAGIVVAADVVTYRSSSQSDQRYVTATENSVLAWQIGFGFNREGQSNDGIRWADGRRNDASTRPIRAF